MRQRIPKRPAARQQSLADVAVNLPKSRPQSPHRDLKRILSEPLFNHLREKLHKIRRKRATSEPESLEAIRQRKLSLQDTASFQIGQQPGKTKSLEKGFSLDSGVDGRIVMPPKRTEVPSSHSRDQIPEEEGIVKKESNETLSAHPPPEEHEQRGDSHSTVGNRRNVKKIKGRIF